MRDRDNRVAGGWGLLFVLLLLTSAGMASVPGGDDPVQVVRVFYEQHAAVVVVAQVIGLAAAVVFTLFALALADGRRAPDGPPGGRWVSATGYAVGAAAVVTAVPVLVLTAVAGAGPGVVVHGLARASDLTDVLLFVAVAAFGVAVSRATTAAWLRALAVLVAVVSLARSMLVLADSSRLELVAPLAFVALVLVISSRAMTRPHVRPALGHTGG